MDTPPSLSVPDARGPESTLTPIPIPTLRRKSAQKHPRYGDAELSLILRFLAAYLTEFEGNLAAERELAKGHEDVKTFAGRILYREHQCATIRELVKRAYWPQRHLSEVTQQEIEERITRCVRQ